jgi:hypothetical protein
MTRKRKAVPQAHTSNRQRCPYCGKRFADILRHLNHRQSGCSDWFNNVSPLDGLAPRRHDSNNDFEDSETSHSDFAPQDYFPEPSGENLTSSQRQSLRHVEFPGAGVTYGHATSFMDQFNSDQYSGSRVDNVYYPFAGKDEWELASFLHSSGLSMRKINIFLKLKLVITNSFNFDYSGSLIVAPRSGTLAYPSPRQRRSVVGWKCSPRSLNGSRKRLPFQIIKRASRCISFIAMRLTASSTYSGIHYLPITWISALSACTRMQSKPSVCMASG